MYKKKFSLLAILIPSFNELHNLKKFIIKLNKNYRVLIIDDYGDFQGCRKAVDEYFSDKNVLMISVDKSCRVIVKN